MKIDFGLVVFCIYPTIFDYVLVFNAFIFVQFLCENENFKFPRNVALFLSYFGFVGLDFLRVKVQMTRVFQF